MSDINCKICKKDYNKCGATREHDCNGALTYCARYEPYDYSNIEAWCKGKVGDCGLIKNGMQTQHPKKLWPSFLKKMDNRFNS